MSQLGTAAIHQGLHIGLQQLEAIAGATHTFLGPNKRYKFIQNEPDEEAVLACSCYRLLEHLELSSSVGQLLHETTRAHWETLRSGTSSLVFLAGVWSRVALECLHKGISIPCIIDGMSVGLEVCMEVCRRNTVTLEEVISKGALLKQPSGGDCRNSEDGASTGPSLNSKLKELPWDTVRTINGVLNSASNKDKPGLKHRMKLKHSRHFNLSDCETEGSVEALYQKHSKAFDVTELAEAVSHGCEVSMSLVIEASKIQCRYSFEEHSRKVLDVDRLVTCQLPGLSEEHASVVHGYVVMMGFEQACLVKHLEERMLKVGLVNGDLSENYCHVGFNRPKNFTYISDCANMSGVSQEDDWMGRALGIILKLSIDVLLVSGVVSPQLKAHCLSHKVLVAEHVKASILSDFATNTQAIPISYITQLSEHCVGAGVHASILSEYCKGKTESILLNIVTSGTSLVTAVITSPVHAKLQGLEDQFWSCAFRLHHALKDGKLLLGAGATELLCIHQLYKHIDVTRSSTSRRTDAAAEIASHEQVIMQLMSESWMDYVSTLMVSAGQVTAKAQAWTCIAQQLKDLESRNSLRSEMPKAPLKKYFSISTLQEEEEKRENKEMAGVYDNVTVKFEVWRSALDLVFLILQTDTEIITGVNERENQFKNAMSL